MTAGEAVEQRAQIAAELCGSHAVGTIGSFAGIEGSDDLCSSVGRFFASASLMPGSVPEPARGLVEAGAASAASRGLREFSRRAALRASEDPGAWAQRGGVILGAQRTPPGMPTKQAAALRAIRRETQRIADEVSSLPAEAIGHSARQASISPPPRAGDVGGVLFAGAAAAALWALVRGA